MYLRYFLLAIATTLTLSTPTFALATNTVEDRLNPRREVLDDSLPIFEGTVFTAQTRIEFQAVELLNEGLRLRQEGSASSLRTAIEKWKAALPLWREVESQSGEAFTLNYIAVVYLALGEEKKALEYYHQALPLMRAVEDKLVEATALINLGTVYYRLGQYSQAIDYYSQSLPIFREIENRNEEASALRNLGLAHYNLAKYREAVDYYEQALPIFQEIENRYGEAATLQDLGNVHLFMGKYEEVRDYHEQALAIFREIENRSGEASSLNGLGMAYKSFTEYSEAIDYYEQALAIFREIENRSGEANTLNNLGEVYSLQGKYKEAIDYHEQALAIRREISDRKGVAVSLTNLGNVYNFMDKYSEAINYYEQSLPIFRELSDRSGEASTLNNLGEVYRKLAKYSEARDYYQQSLDTYKEIDAPAQISSSLGNLGAVSLNLEEYEEAIDYYQRSLNIAVEIADLVLMAKSLTNLGNAYLLSERPEAFGYYKRALSIAEEINDLDLVASSLGRLGIIYHGLGEYEQAISYYQRSLAIKLEIGNRSGAAETYNNLAGLLQSQDQPELAIIFYKQAVNTYESLRQDTSGLDPDLQQSYTRSVADTYKRLADLLLDQDRVLEAQRVIDLLRLQELEEYLRNTRGNSNSRQGIELLPSERQIWEKFTPERPNFDLRTWIESPEITNLVRNLKQKAQAEKLDLAYVASLKTFLEPLGQEVALLYPLIREDQNRLELIVVTAKGEPIRHTVDVSRDDLKQTIFNLRTALTNPNEPANRAGQTAYNLVFAPLEADLARLGIDTLIYAPDGILRYVPLAAFHDGEQWLIERFSINNITSGTLMDFRDRPSEQMNVVAAGFADTETTYNFYVEDIPYGFSGLEFADEEVNSIASTIPQTTRYLDREFNKDIIDSFNQHKIVHLATHAEFIPGYASESFILFGDGSRATLRELENWNLKDVELVVLSACKTATGELGDGVEFLGLGYQMQRAGAEATIASLWTVRDQSTQVLMSEFYRQLTTQKSKTEALREAQISLIKEGIFEHPYHWSPFILIGNGL